MADSFDPATGKITTIDGWGNPKIIDESANIQTTIDALVRDTGITPEEARGIVINHVSAQVAAGRGEWALSSFNNSVGGMENKNDLIKSGHGTYDALKRQAAERKAAMDAASAEANAGQVRNISGQMQTFIDSMLGPLAQNDPIRASLVQAGTDSAQAFAGRAGLGGRSGLGATQAGSTTQQAVSQYEAQRKQIGLGGLNALSGRDISLGQLEMQNTQMKNQAADAAAAAQQNQNSTIGSIIGGGLGALGFLGGPAIGAATMSGGSALGGAIGGGLSRPPVYQSGGYGGGKSGQNPFTGY